MNLKTKQAMKDFENASSVLTDILFDLAPNDAGPDSAPNGRERWRGNLTVKFGREGARANTEKAFRDAIDKLFDHMCNELVADAQDRVRDAREGLSAALAEEQAAERRRAE